MTHLAYHAGGGFELFYTEQADGLYQVTLAVAGDTLLWNSVGGKKLSSIIKYIDIIKSYEYDRASRRIAVQAFGYFLQKLPA